VGFLVFKNRDELRLLTLNQFLPTCKVIY